MTTDPSVIGIVSPNYSGSTVVGAAVGSASDACFVGEPALIWRTDAAGRWRDRIFCGSCGAACPVWTDEVVARLRTGPPSPTEAHRVARSHTGATIVVDSSKDRQWFESVSDLALLHVSRSVGATAISSRLHHEARTGGGRLPRPIALARHAIHWSRSHEALRTAASRSSLPYLHVRLRDLADDIPAIEGLVGRHLQIDRSGDAMEIPVEWRHWIKGNPGVRAQTGGSTRSLVVRRDLDDWPSGDGRLGRWIERIPPVSATSRHLGYP